MSNVKNFREDVVMTNIFLLFKIMSPEFDSFLLKMDTLWRKKGIDPQSVPDVDEATQLSDEEYKDLREELGLIIYRFGLSNGLYRKVR